MDQAARRFSRRGASFFDFHSDPQGNPMRHSRHGISGSISPPTLRGQPPYGACMSWDATIRQARRNALGPWQGE